MAVCDEWTNDFSQFFTDLGLPKEGEELGRLDKTKGYFKDNCKWMTRKENTRLNSLSNKLWHINGQVFNTLGEASEATGINRKTIHFRCCGKKQLNGTFTPKKAGYFSTDKPATRGN